MVVPYDWDNRIWKVNRGQYVSADTRVKLHFLELGWRKRTGFVENIFWYGQLTHVMQKSSRLDRANKSYIGNTHALRQTDCVSLNPADVTMGDLILGVNSHGQGLNGRHVEVVQFSQMPVCVDCAAYPSSWTIAASPVLNQPSPIARFVASGSW